MGDFVKNDIAVYQATAAPFVLEHRKEYKEAIKAHENAAAMLQTFIEKNKSKMRKFHRKMFERQMQVHLDRNMYLKGLAATGNFGGVVVPPTILSANDDLRVDEGQNVPLSLDHKTLCEYAESSGGKIDISNGPDAIKHLLDDSPRPFSPTLNPSLPPTVYQITHSSELVWVGTRSHWMYIRDESNTHTLWAMQALWSIDVPITEALLRRAGEFLPGAGAVHVSLIKTQGGSFRLKMQSLSTGTVIEVPDRAERTRDWSPRQFDYGGRKFVWKEGPPERMFGFRWETLYETRRVWPREGSRTGEMDDEVVGPRLCWGENNSGFHANHKLYFAAGMDQCFREHLLASQLARYIRHKYPPKNDVQGVEATTATAAGFLALAVNIGNIASVFA